MASEQKLSKKFSTLLGDKLLKHESDEPIDTAKALDSVDYVLFYFSAHWCPPCRQFTPMLANYYKEEASKKRFEVVFVSSDRDEKSFTEYWAEHPWLALPYSDRKLKDKLSRRFKVQGIPTLVVLEAATGKVITTEGRMGMLMDKEGFPWAPPSLNECLPSELLVEHGKKRVNTAAALAGKYVGLLFSASWCGPCRAWKPELVACYEKVKAKRDDFVVVLVGADRDQESFSKFYQDMPESWLAFPFEEKGSREKINQALGIEGIPSFVMAEFNEANQQKGKVINEGGRSAVSADPEGAEFPWHPKPVMELQMAASFINDETTVLVLADAASDSQRAEASQALASVAEQMKRKPSNDDDDDDDDDENDLRFSIASSPSGVVEQIRLLTKLGAPKEGDKRTVCDGDSCMQVDATSPVLLILDIPDQGGFYLSPSPSITINSIQTFISQYRQGKLERQQLSRD